MATQDQRRWQQRPDILAMLPLAGGFVMGLGWPTEDIRWFVEMSFYASWLIALFGRSGAGITPQTSRRCLIIFLMGVAAYVGLLFVDLGPPTAAI
jgi:hypothetical protein